MERMVSGNELLLVGQHSARHAGAGLRVVRRAARPPSIRHAGWRSRSAAPLDQPRALSGAGGASELEVVQRPAPDENGVERQHPRNAADAWWFKVKDGVSQVRFGDPGWRLGYARDAVNSYFVFNTLKEKGVLPAHLRFQVSIPMVNSVLPPRIFPNRDDLDRIRPGYEAATRAEIAMIVEQDSGDGSGDPMGLFDRGSGQSTAPFRASRSPAPSSAISMRCAICRRTSRAMSRSAITSASARSAAGRAFSRTISARP